MKKLNEQGFSHVIALVLLVVVVGVASLGAWRVATNVSDAKKVNDAPVSKTASAPSTISSKQDVAQARQALQADESDTSLNDTQLDKDITSLY